MYVVKNLENTEEQKEENHKFWCVTILSLANSGECGIGQVV